MSEKKEMYTQELIEKVKAYRKDKLQTVRMLKKQGSYYSNIESAKADANNALTLLDEYSCMLANSKSNYPKDIQEQFLKFADNAYTKLIDLINE